MYVAQTIVQLLEQMADRPLPERQALRRGYEFATRIFTGRYRACGRPFETHLVGTASALHRFGAPIEMVLAGLLHAAYEQGVFPRSDDRRTQLREAIGEAAERLVFEYQNFDTRRVPDDVGEAERDVVLLRIANALDECADRGARYLGPAKRAGVIGGIAKYVAAAGRYGLPEIAAELEAAVAANEGDPEPGLATEHNGSYTIDPPLAPLLRKRAKQARRTLKRKLRGR